ncbi:MAG: polyribonucleotide nucleotidyltransferase [Tissierellia bacterium]|nr:polyribonucleotide nucleotidyltransferase [Tissierellia bacterium]
MIKKYEYQLKNESLEITIGKVAEQANGACLVRWGDTVVLVTATASKEPREGIDFFPLTCDFEEKQYAAGKIPGGFIKREGRPTEKATLTARLIDRPLRPLFPEGYHNDVQVIATVLSVDEDHTPDVLAMIGSSVALTISDIPFQGPTAAVGVGYIDGEYVLNLNKEERDKSQLELTVAGTKEAIMMVEAGADKLTEEVMLGAILFAHEEIQKICDFIESIREDCGKEKSLFTKPSIDEELITKVDEFAAERLLEAIRNEDKVKREDEVYHLREETLEHFNEEYEDRKKEINARLDELEKDEVRRLIVEDHIRPDNRHFDEIRELHSEVGILPRTHGSGLFTRGQTQVLSVATLGSPSDVQILDGIIEEEDKQYMHHYNFPPYSVGDTRPLRSPGRREIGHGALAERALIPVLPSEDEFPYTIRVVSEVLSSNGSSSQASVCGSSLSLMDAGVPILEPVAGIAMGLIKEGDKVVVLTDIQGLEDHLGDMDFKVAGTKNGITALQMDIKIKGISKEILEEALAKAKNARLKILENMTKAIAEPNELSKLAPRILKIKIHPEKVREVIGPGGKVINGIIDETGVKIDTEDDGSITVTGENSEMAEKAIAMIERIVKDPEPGETYLGTVKKIMNFGAFVEILPGKEGLLHISNIAHEHTKRVEDVLHEGDEVLVKVTEIDNQDRINLSRKALLPKPERKNNDRDDNRRKDPK